MNISDKLFLSIISLLTIAAICSTAYIFLIREDYDFIIEAPCNPATETCFTRDCSEGDCPPNELEEYRVFSVRAEDFSKCADNSCLQECTGGTIPCSEIICGESEEDSCAEIPDSPSQE